jgi:membrane protease subunit (stomatin/prohibitin family)
MNDEVVRVYFSINNWTKVVNTNYSQIVFYQNPKYEMPKKWGTNRRADWVNEFISGSIFFLKYALKIYEQLH